MRSAEEVLALYQTRKDRLATTHAIFRGIRAAILGDVDVPLPELDSTEKASVANLILTGVTQTANRIASTMPTPYMPPLRPGIDLSEQRARTRRSRTLDWYDKVNLNSIMRKRALHYLSYAAAPVVVKPNPAYTETNSNEVSPVIWEVRDPLATYTADMPTGQCVPDDAIFTFTRSYSWIANRYGTEALGQLAVQDRDSDPPITLLEYIDADWLCLYALTNVTKEEPAQGPMYGIQGFGATAKAPPGKPCVTISGVPNRAHRPLSVVAGMISLERPQSMYEGLVDLLQQQSRLMALEYIGMMRSIWPEEWLVSPDGGNARIVQQADPLAGIMGQVEGGTITINAPQPAQFGVNLIDRLERAQRVQGSIPAEYGGESATNTRTDKRGNSILSNTIDFGILAAHESFEQSLRAENRIAADIEKCYFPGTKTFATTSGKITYEPAEVWESNAVGWMRYPSAGSDADGLVVAGGQRLGIGTMSKRSFMEIDPLVDDPELETERVRSEQLEAMLFANLQALAQQDPNYMTVIAKLNEKLREDMAPNIMATWLKLDDEYKQKQAEAQQQAAPPDAAEGQPGLAAPGADQPGGIGAPPPSLANLGGLTQLLRHTSRSPAPPVAVGG